MTQSICSLSLKCSPAHRTAYSSGAAAVTCIALAILLALSAVAHPEWMQIPAFYPIFWTVTAVGISSFLICIGATGWIVSRPPKAPDLVEPKLVQSGSVEDESDPTSPPASSLSLDGQRSKQPQRHRGNNKNLEIFDQLDGDQLTPLRRRELVETLIKQNFFPRLSSSLFFYNLFKKCSHWSAEDRDFLLEIILKESEGLNRDKGETAAVFGLLIDYLDGFALLYDKKVELAKRIAEIDGAFIAESFDRFKLNPEELEDIILRAFSNAPYQIVKKWDSFGIRYQPQKIQTFIWQNQDVDKLIRELEKEVSEKCFDLKKLRMIVNLLHEINAIAPFKKDHCRPVQSFIRAFVETHNQEEILDLAYTINNKQSAYTITFIKTLYECIQDRSPELCRWILFKKELSAQTFCEEIRLYLTKEGVEKGIQNRLTGNRRAEVLNCADLASQLEEFRQNGDVNRAEFVVYLSSEDLQRVGRIVSFDHFVTLHVEKVEGALSIFVLDAQGDQRELFLPKVMESLIPMLKAQYIKELFVLGPKRIRDDTSYSVLAINDALVLFDQENVFGMLEREGKLEEHQTMKCCAGQTTIHYTRVSRVPACLMDFTQSFKQIEAAIRERPEDAECLQPIMDGKAFVSEEGKKQNKSAEFFLCDLFLFFLEAFIKGDQEEIPYW